MLFVRRIALACLALSLVLAGCAAPEPQVIQKEVTRVVKETVVQEKVVKEAVEVPVEVTRVVEKVVEKEVLPTAAPEKKAKYLFVFIGDGMAVAQRNAAELYLAAMNKTARPEDTKLVINTFPAQGMNTTYDLTSVIPDSASTGTAIASGHKTASGVVGMDPAGKISYETITEIAKKAGRKVGVISSVSLDHATPAAFYGHQPTRKNMYELNIQLANSGFDYFAGGQMAKPTKDGQPNAMELAEKNGYKVVSTRSDLMALKPGSGKVLAVSGVVDRSAAMYYQLDHVAGEPTLADFTAKGIELLDNPNGFVLAVEAGKIDWACHANDAGAAIHDTLAFDAAVAEAVKFYEKHPDETLIVVTGDHETGGMTIGYAGTKYSSFMDKIQHQKMSYIEFGNKLAEYKESHTPQNAKFEDMLGIIEEGFGLTVLSEAEKADLEAKAKEDKEAQAKLGMVLSDLELQVLREAFVASMAGEEVKSSDPHTYLLYGGYEPLAVKLTTILNQKSGISWTSYSHTGVPVQTSAMGVGCDAFNGYYDQTDIFVKMKGIAGL